MRAKTILMLVSMLGLAGCFDAHVNRDGGASGGDTDVLAICEVAPSISRCVAAPPCDDVECGEGEDCFLMDFYAWTNGEVEHRDGVCLPRIDSRIDSDSTCDRLGCGLGAVCTLHVREPPSPPEILIDIGACTPAEECVQARGALGLEPPAGCFYGDLSPAQSGTTPAVDCAALPQEDLCGRGCECERGPCLLASETHPIGVCYSAIDSYSCRGSGACPRGGCLEVRAPPEVADRWPILARYARCATRDVCVALSSLYPDVYSCLP